MKKFKVGDRVRAIKMDDGNTHIIGKIGTVKKNWIFYEEPVCDVEFDEHVNGHDLNGCCKYGKGWSCGADTLEPVHDNKEFKVGEKYRVVSFDKENGNVIEIININQDEDVAFYRTLVGISPTQNSFAFDSDFSENLIPYTDNKIIITTDGKTTIAKMYDGKKLVNSAKAVCSPDDEFDFERGAGIAISRLLDWIFVPDNTLEKEELYTGKVVCVKGGYYNSFFKVGKIYHIKNGFISSEAGMKFLGIKSIQSFNESNKGHGIEFLEIVE